MFAARRSGEGADIFFCNRTAEIHKKAAGNSRKVIVFNPPTIFQRKEIPLIAGADQQFVFCKQAVHINRLVFKMNFAVMRRFCKIYTVKNTTGADFAAI